MVGHLAQIVAAGELRIAQDPSEDVVGCYVLGRRPAYAPVISEPERYIEAMVTSRALAGQGIGALLVNDAIDRSHLADAHTLRTDCWAEAPGLIRWYEERGFERGEEVRVGEWPARMLHMSL
jgi:GNAT superfamily N-acetyltransferase